MYECTREHAGASALCCAYLCTTRIAHMNRVMVCLVSRLDVIQFDRFDGGAFREHVCVVRCALVVCAHCQAVAGHRRTVAINHQPAITSNGSRVMMTMMRMDGCIDAVACIRAPHALGVRVGNVCLVRIFPQMSPFQSSTQSLRETHALQHKTAHTLR